MGAAVGGVVRERSWRDDAYEVPRAAARESPASGLARAANGYGLFVPVTASADESICQPIFLSLLGLLPCRDGTSVQDVGKLYLASDYTAPYVTDVTRFFARQGAALPLPSGERID